jgi:hypothetical protein
MTARDGRRPATRTSAAAPARRPAARWAIAMLGVLEVVASAGCSDSAPHGPPKLLQVYWETRGGVQMLVWSSNPTDGPLQTTVSPAATQFDLVFDHVIDGSKIEDTVTVNGVATQVPKAVPPVTVTWPTMVDPTGQMYKLAVWYNSIHLPIAPANTTYVYGRETPSYPSSTALLINIPASNITSKYNEPMLQIDPIMLTTEAFGVVINPPPNAAGTTSDDAGAPPPTYVPTNFWVPLQFNNIPVTADPTLLAASFPQYLQVRQNGVLLTPGQYQLQVSASDPTLILVQPGSIQIWDSGSQLDVTVSADLPDIYGAALGQDVTASFIPCQLVGEDAGVRVCAPPMHVGGVDAGATDAPFDVPVSPDAAEAGLDADETLTDGAVD